MPRYIIIDVIRIIYASFGIRIILIRIIYALFGIRIIITLT